MLSRGARELDRARRRKFAGESKSHGDVHTAMEVVQKCGLMRVDPGKVQAPADELSIINRYEPAIHVLGQLTWNERDVWIAVTGTTDVPDITIRAPHVVSIINIAHLASIGHAKRGVHSPCDQPVPMFVDGEMTRNGSELRAALPALNIVYWQAGLVPKRRRRYSMPRGCS